MAAPIASLASPVVYHTAAADVSELSCEAGQDLPAMLTTNAVDDADTTVNLIVFTRNGKIVPRTLVANGTGAGQWSVRETT